MELRECPFCGSLGALQFLVQPIRFWVVCVGCKSTGPVITDTRYHQYLPDSLQEKMYQDAADAWSTRSPLTDDRLVEAHQRLRETLQYCLGGLLAVREMLGKPDFAANHIKMAEEALGEVV